MQERSLHGKADTPAPGGDFKAMEPDPISCPPAAKSAQFRDVDTRSGPGYPPYREGEGVLVIPRPAISGRAQKGNSNPLASRRRPKSS
jgi:hypothetical protein